MANPTLKQILEDTRRLVAKQAAASKGAEITGEAPSSMPGAEHDKPVPSEAKKPDAETRDGTMVPTSGLSTAGAGDDSPKTRGHALGSEEAAETPVKKPAITADANAKTAGDATATLANEILTLVRTAQKSAATPAPAPEKKEAAAPAPAPVPEKKETAAPAPAPVKAAGGELNMELTTDVMAKIAALILSTEEGAQLAEAVLQKAAGAEMAQETLSFLAQQSELAEKQAAFEQGQADAQALIDQQIYAAGQKAAADKQSAEMFFKLGQAAADASISDLMGGDTGAAGGAADMGGAGAAPGGESAAPGGDMGGEDITMEDLMAALESLVADGTLQPEEAQSVMAYLTQGGEAAGGEAAGGEAAPAEGAAPAGGEGGAPTEEAKEAKAKPQQKAAALLDVIRQLQQPRK